MDETGGGTMGLQAHESMSHTELAFRPGSFCRLIFFLNLQRSFFLGHDFTGCGKTQSGSRPGILSLAKSQWNQWALQAAKKLPWCQFSKGFVTGHDFSRAAKFQWNECGLQPLPKQVQPISPSEGLFPQPV
jgi:hypothetical protein